MAQWSVGVQTTSTAVVSVNQTGEAMFGRPFVVKTQYGYQAFNQATVLTGNSSVVVAVVGFSTASEPDS